MADTFRNGYPGINWSFPEGADLLMTSATVGILVASIVGIILINIGAKKGYCKRLVKPEELPDEIRVGVIPVEKHITIAKATVSPESIEPFAFHVALVFIAMLFGYIIDDFLKILGIFLIFLLLGINVLATALDAIPTFPLTMIGGVILQILLNLCQGVSVLSIETTIERIQGRGIWISLVVSAIASYKLFCCL